jgi:hypothetical protein
MDEPVLQRPTAKIYKFGPIIVEDDYNGHPGQIVEGIYKDEIRIICFRKVARKTRIFNIRAHKDRHHHHSHCKTSVANLTLMPMFVVL